MNANRGPDGALAVRKQHTGRLIALPSQRRTDLDEHLARVDAVLAEVIADLQNCGLRCPARSGVVQKSSARRICRRSSER